MIKIVTTAIGITLGLLACIIPAVVSIYVLMLIPLWLYGLLTLVSFSLGLLMSVLYRERHATNTNQDWSN